MINENNTKQDAKTVIIETPKVLQRRKFPLAKMVVSDSELYKLIPEESRAQDDVELSPDSVTKALGIKWHISSDTFYFEFTYVARDSISRRELLSVLSSTYDPLGLIGCYIVTGKLIFQEATRRKLNWDEKINPD